jgi:hypothetical protein
MLQLGMVGIVVTLNFSWWVLVFGLMSYAVCGGCPLTWTGFSIEAFSDCGFVGVKKMRTSVGGVQKGRLIT